MGKLARQGAMGLAGLCLAMAALLFGVPWTFDYWQAWLFLTVYFACSIAMTLYLAIGNPELLQRRMRGGPMAEKEPAQRLIMMLASAGFVGLLIVPALDRRFGWSHLSRPAVLAGDALVALGWLAMYFVFRENKFTAATIEVATDQRVISTGPYAYVRHPMYAGALVMLLGIPIALGSGWGLLVLAATFAVLVWRMIDEERSLSEKLRGYAAYKEKVRYRLIPHLW